MNYLFLIAVIAIVAVTLGIAAFTNLELDDAHYDRLKWLTIRWSYIVTFVGLIAKTFSMPYGVETVTVVAGIGALMAGLMGISTNNWKLTQPQNSFNADSFDEMLSEVMDHEDTEEVSTEE